MSGYVEYNGLRSPLKNKPRASENEYVFTPGVFLFIEDKADYKFYEWKASKSEIKPSGKKTWVAKKRLGKDDVSRDQQVRGRDLVDKTDPNFDAAQIRKDAQEKIDAADEVVRRYYGMTLPDYLAKQKTKKAKKGGGK